MNRESLHKRVHFYYCAIVALKIIEQEKGGCSHHARNRFLLQWLAAAQRKKLFGNALVDEILWLRRHINDTGLENDSLPLLTTIYQQGRLLQMPLKTFPIPR